MAVRGGEPDARDMLRNRPRAARPRRLVLVLVAAAAVFALQSGSALAWVLASSHTPARVVATRPDAAAPAAGGSAHVATALPTQGIFDSCALSSSLSTCEQDLLQIHQAGMQVAVLSVQGDSLAQISAYAAYAQSIGMSVMWEINDPGFWGGAWIGASAAADWSQFSQACGCTATSQILSYMIGWLSALPATYGYYAADDSTLNPGQVAGLTQYVDAIKAADPRHMVMVGSNEGQGTTYYPTGATIGNEIYPETTTSLLPYGPNIAMWQAIQQGVAQDAHAAARAGTGSAFILQAFTFGDNIWDGEATGVCTASMSQAQCASLLLYPSAGVQLELRNQVLAYAHPQLILWYTFSEASQGSRWAGLSSVVQAPYPVGAQAARAGHSHRAAALLRGRGR